MYINELRALNIEVNEKPERLREVETIIVSVKGDKGHGNLSFHDIPFSIEEFKSKLPAISLFFHKNIEDWHKDCHKIVEPKNINDYKEKEFCSKLLSDLLYLLPSFSHDLYYLECSIVLKSYDGTRKITQIPNFDSIRAIMIQ